MDRTRRVDTIQQPQMRKGGCENTWFIPKRRKSDQVCLEMEREVGLIQR